MKFGLSFLATDIGQLPRRSADGPTLVEAVIFNRSDLEKASWDIIWKNISMAISEYCAENVTFHFPVNDSDYVNDPFVRSRLSEAHSRACDHGLCGIVVHANRVMPIKLWSSYSVNDERSKVAECLEKISSQNCGSGCWIGLENMPVMDNSGDLIDPTFVFPEDFSILQGGQVKITWDICHFLNTIETCNLVTMGKSPREDFPNFRVTSKDSYLVLIDQIVHWHFSSFLGVPNRRNNEVCQEGVLPWEGTLSEEEYLNALCLMSSVNSEARCIFEVTEKNYRDRVNGRAMLSWARNLIGTVRMVVEDN